MYLGCSLPRQAISTRPTIKALEALYLDRQNSWLGKQSWRKEGYNTHHCRNRIAIVIFILIWNLFWEGSRFRCILLISLYRKMTLKQQYNYTKNLIISLTNTLLKYCQRIKMKQFYFSMITLINHKSNKISRQIFKNRANKIKI